MNLAQLSIKRPTFITSLVILMLIIGGMSLSKMSVDMYPDVTFPIVTVQITYKGASPVDMEKLVSKPIEDELGSLAGLKSISSSSLESMTLVVLEFQLESDIKDAEQQVRQRLGNIRRQLPSEMDEPIVRRVDPADQAIVRLAVGSSSIAPGKLYDFVENEIKPRFENLSGVGQVEILGGRKREILVAVDKNKIEDRRISLLQIADRIRSTSKDVPIGKIENSKLEVTARALGEFESIDAIRKVNIQFLGSDFAMPLSSVASVQEGLEKETTSASFMNREDNFVKRPAIYLDVYKQSGSNTIKVVDLVVSQVAKVNGILKNRNVDVMVSHMRDSARPVRLNVTDVKESIFIGIALLIVVVFFFLGSFRSTFITGMALPNSLLGGFILMNLMGFSINLMTLLALSLAVGLLIDDAIVVRENIFRYLEMGKSPLKAAEEGTNEVALAVIATTLVVIAVFGPIGFLDGMVGKFFKQFGLSVVFMMIISIFDAFTVAPMLSAYMATSSEHQKDHGFFSQFLKKLDALQTHLENTYASTLEWILGHRKITLSSALLIFIVSMGLIRFIPKTFLPQAEMGEFVVSVELPVGTALAETKRFASKIEDDLKKDPAIVLLSTVVGRDGFYLAPNKAGVYARLVPSKERKESTTAIKQRYRFFFEKYTKGVANTFIQVGDVDPMGMGSKVFNLNITGNNLEHLATYADQLKARLIQVKGLVDVDTNYRVGTPEFQVVFDRAKAESLGVSTITAGSELRARIDGVVPATYRENGEEYDIRLRLSDKDQDLRKEFHSTSVPNANFDKIPLWKVAKPQETTGYSQINRQDRSRYVNISANLGPDGSLGNIIAEVQKLMTSDPKYKLPSELSYRFRGQAENLQELITNMLLAMLLGICFIYLVLASLYESFITPLTILLALPMAITGAFLGLLVTGKNFDIFSMIGLVMLLGVSAKNSILLVDYTQRLMAEGMERNKALVAAGRIRLRPILMTSLALIAGSIPIALGLNEASAQRTSMGIAIIGGLLSSTLLTLVVVPAAFGYIDNFRIRMGRLGTRLLGRQ